jgi:transposase-like protein
LRRAADGEGEVLEILVQPQRDKAAAVELSRKP